MKRSKFEVAQIIKKFGADFTKQYKPNSYILRTLNALQICRTSALGGHKEKCNCDSCGHIRFSYNSCRNRHCPKCQASKQAFWVEDTMDRIIDTKYFHIVFTVPDVLNSICLLDSKKFYNTLFKCMWDTLRTFGYTQYGVESGAVAILHTWGQNLSLHPHIHCLVPAVGLTFADNLKKVSKKGKYLYNVKQLSLVFRGKIMQNIKKQVKSRNLLFKYQDIIDDAWSKKWVIFCEPSFKDAERVIKYLGQYTHRVAISNNRILNIDDNGIVFHYKDYRDDSKIKPTKLNGIEFLRRFCMHILPKGFVKIRYYGILSNRYRKKTAIVRRISKKNPNENIQQRLKRLTGFDMCICPVCKKGKMQVVEVIPRIRSPVKSFLFDLDG